MELNLEQEAFLQWMIDSDEFKKRETELLIFQMEEQKTTIQEA